MAERPARSRLRSTQGAAACLTRPFAKSRNTLRIGLGVLGSLPITSASPQLPRNIDCVPRSNANAKSQSGMLGRFGRSWKERSPKHRIVVSAGGKHSVWPHYRSRGAFLCAAHHLWTAGLTACQAPSHRRSGSRSPCCASLLMSGARGQRHLKGDAHLDRFAVKFATVGASRKPRREGQRGFWFGVWERQFVASVLRRFRARCSTVLNWSRRTCRAPRKETL